MTNSMESFFKSK